MKDESSERWTTLKIKADLLCMGIRFNDVARDIYRRQNPCFDTKTGNVGIHLVLDSRSYVLVTVSHAFDQQSPYFLAYHDNQLVLMNDGDVVRQVQITETPMPNWYSNKTTTGSLMPSFFLHEGKSFLHQAYSGCDFHSLELACKFCGTGSSWKIGLPIEVGETVAAAVEENQGYHVCLGGGTRMPGQRNIDYFAECITSIRERNVTVPIWIEMTPPENNSDILHLVGLGANSFGFNIEIWDDTMRKEICPGKSSISKNRYLGASSEVLRALGPNRVGSCLVVGLESIDSSIEGATILTENGIQPCILPFKPWDKSHFKNMTPCKAEDLIQVSKRATEAMIKNRISPADNQGCLLCDGCTIDHDMYELLTVEGRQL